MKLLHTSDWHLGQSFFNKSRKDEHQAFIQWLLALIQAEQVDVVVIAGDIFDNGNPPSYARELYNQFVVDLHKHHCSLVVLGGNHDSVATLNESKQVLACLNTAVVASSALPLEQQLIDLEDAKGNIIGLLCAVPYIRPKDVLQSRAGESALQKQDALTQAIKQHYHALYIQALERKTANGWDVPIIATGHLTAMGVSQSDSVREIYIGTLDGFAAEGFPPADYIALGHIHRPQVVAKSAHIRYSGSPIPLSFDELNSTKQVMLVEFTGAKRTALTAIDVPVFQPMAVLKGDLLKLEKQLQALHQSHQDKPVWLCLEVESQDYLSDLQQRVQALVAPMNVEILQLRRARNPERQLLSQQQQESLAELQPHEVFDKRLQMENFATEQDQARLARIRQRFSEILLQVQQQEAEL